MAALTWAAKPALMRIQFKKNTRTCTKNSTIEHMVVCRARNKWYSSKNSSDLRGKWV
jgi:hypothetical protein